MEERLRKPKFTNREIADALRKHKGKVYKAAAEIGCTAATIFSRMNQFLYIRMVAEDAKGIIVDIAEDKLYEAVEEGKVWAVKYMLSTQGRDRGYVTRQEMTGLEGKSLLPSRYEDMDDNSFRDAFSKIASIAIEIAYKKDTD